MKMPRRSGCFILIAILTVFVACQKPAQPLPSSPPSPPPSSPTDTAAVPKDTSTAKVYVLGTTNDSVVYWTKGVPTLLSTDPTAYANAMVLVDSDVYICGGRGIIDTFGTANYWKNGISVSLGTVPDALGANARGISVAGGDVYVGGITYFNDLTNNTSAKWGGIPVLWKNGQPTMLPDWSGYVEYFGYFQNVRSNYVSSVYTSGSDVYVTGGGRVPIVYPPPYHFTGYWKNGVYIDLPNRLTDSGVLTTVSSLPTIESMVINGSDVYAVGYQNSDDPNFWEAVYWKNGVLFPMTPPPYGSWAYAMQIVGNDVYVVGISLSAGPQHATYWKNGVAALVDSSMYATDASSIFVSGNDVYVAGEKTYNGIGYATYWKNGVEHQLGYNGSANTIIVRY